MLIEDDFEDSMLKNILNLIIDVFASQGAALSRRNGLFCQRGLVFVPIERD